MAKKIPYESKRRHNYKTRYGISVEEYEAIFAKQNGVCAICEKPENLTKDGKLHTLAVDHNHETLQVRGLLCMNCNTRLGYFESKGILVKLMAYLMRQA
jgi:hypothetical protein